MWGALPCCRLPLHLFFTEPAAMADPTRKLDCLLAEQDGMIRRQASLKAELKKAKGLCERVRRAWLLSTFAIHVVLIAYALCEYQAPAAIKFLAITGRKRRWPERSESELLELVENLFMECEVTEFAELADLEDPKDPKAFAEAVRYSEEWKMAVFVEDQNSRLGVAPTTEALLHRWACTRAKYGTTVRPMDPGLVAEAKGRKWAHRWRVRWGARHGAIRVRDEQPLEETRTKASCTSSP